MIRRLICLTAFGCAPLVSVACAREPVLLAEGPAPSSTAFGAADSGITENADADASLPEETPMCPVTTCAWPYTTCASSAFLCDVNLLSDDENCGACGVRCGGPNVAHSKWSCVDGKCAFSCDDPEWRDCDGNPTNGCEASIKEVKNCGACGRQCADGLVCEKGECVTRCELLGSPDECPDPDHPPATVCTDVRKDDKNCAACGHVCDPTGPGLPPLPSDDMYYGCGDKKCTAPKCKVDGMADCNMDLNDGCETPLLTSDNCRFCGDKCDPGQICFLNPFTGPECICGPGETRCFGFNCVRLDDDPNNCGGCNRKCPGSDRPHFAPTCSGGVCSGQCEEKFADCDGLPDNGCEIDTRVDNRNCGGCGHACLPGQVCSGGECLVAPCQPEGPTAK